MFGIMHRLKVLRMTNSDVSLNSLSNQIRWHRKPRWVPKAKTKIFRIPERPSIPVEEREELKRLMNNYRTQIKSIRRYLTYRYGATFQASADPEQQRKVFEDDLAHCMEINDKWNGEQKVLREDRVAKELEAEIEFAKTRLASELENRELQLKEADEIVRKLKEEAKTFITQENIDAAIENAIANPIDYNFAIDIYGNKIMGRETKPEGEEKKAMAQS